MQSDHPQNYMFLDQNGQLCAHCLVSPQLFQDSTSANYRISARTAAADNGMLYAVRAARISWGI
jgi:hypothetical protein